MTSPGSLSALRATNRRRLLSELRGGAGLKQADLARATGLSAATVSGLVRAMADEGTVVLRAGSSDGRRGRFVQLAEARRPLALGIDLGRSHLRVVLGSGSECVLAEAAAALPVGHSPTVAFALVEELVTRVHQEAGIPGDVVSTATMALARPVPDSSGATRGEPGVHAWSGLKVSEIMSDALGLDVRVENDANLGALAVAGLASPDHPSVYVKIGHGIGAGITYRGEVVRGAGGMAGNIGHLAVDPRLAAVCQCGRRGCLETIASAEAVRRTTGAALNADLDLDAVVRLVEEGNPVAVQVIEEAGEFVGRALGWLATILNPEAILVGGPLVAVGDAFMASARRSFEQCVTESVRSTGLGVSPLGERTEVIGALVHALRRVDVEAPR